MRELVESCLAVDLTDINLWHAVIAILQHAVIWRLLAFCECKIGLLSSTLNCSQKQAGDIASTATFVLAAVRLSCVQSACRSQPRWVYFHDNLVLFLGLWNVIAGIVLAVGCIFARGFPQSLACVHCDVYGTNIASKSLKLFPYNMFDEPMSVAMVLVHLGLSLLSASQAGVLLTLLIYMTNSCNLLRNLASLYQYRSIQDTFLLKLCCSALGKFNIRGRWNG